eukprot:scaffold86187_cov40-Prasinocladus_malaysianus.AAC.1
MLDVHVAKALNNHGKSPCFNASPTRLHVSTRQDVLTVCCEGISDLLGGLLCQLAVLLALPVLRQGLCATQVEAANSAPSDSTVLIGALCLVRGVGVAFLAL